MKLRSELNEQETWDLTGLFKDEAAFDNALDELKALVDQFVVNYENELKDAGTVTKALHDYHAISVLQTQIGTYASLHLSADQSNEANSLRMGKVQNHTLNVSKSLNFLRTDLMELDSSILTDVQSDVALKPFIDDLLRDQPYYLGKDQEALLTSLGQVLNAPYGTYNKAKLADLKFDDFEVNGKTYPLSFVYYENVLEFHEDHDVRHAAYKHFNEGLKKYEQTIAAIYQTQVLKEKAIADARGYDSVIDYLLHSQNVSRDMYDRQIDLAMEHLAPFMREYAGLLQNIHGIDKMKFEDLKLSVDFEYEPEISIEESRDYIADGLSILGEDYVAMVKRAYDERWVDFPQSVGKSTGAFCSSPYGNHPYILINWTEKMREVFVMAHELGHAGHFYLSGQAQSQFGTRASTYFIEAPSTMNELIMANHLMKQKQEPRFRRWVLSTMISRTYYHNFVTHLLEAAFQREVYRYVDEGKALSAQVFHNLKREVLEAFWGDAVEITPGAEKTWMRQPHYYMGLYPYTYSAGLTIATQASKQIMDGSLDIQRWIELLQLGGTKSPLELAQYVNVDMSNDNAILATIDEIGSMIHEIISLTNEL